jgi:hypothetical protein
MVVSIANDKATPKVVSIFTIFGPSGVRALPWLLA